MSETWRTDEGEISRQNILRAYPLELEEVTSQLDRIARLAANLCDAPIGLVSIVDADLQKFAGRSGLQINQTPRKHSFCARAMFEDGCTIVPDAREDGRFADNPLVTGAPFIRFYASWPIRSAEGAPLGSLCIIDQEPRKDLAPRQSEGLETLALAAMAILERWRIDTSSKLFTSRLRSENAEMEQRFQVLADAMPHLVWSAAPDGQADYFSQRWCEFTGFPEQESFGELWMRFLHPDDMAPTGQAWADAIQNGGGYEIRYRLRHHSGEFRWVMAKGLPLSDETGKITRWIGTCTDVHDEIEAAEQQELLSQELSHRIKNIFAVIGGLISLSIRTNPEFAELGGELQSRVLALGRAHDFVRPHSGASMPVSGVSSLQGMLGSLLAPYETPKKRKFHISGPDVGIDDRSATPLALLFHELATNSAKYGALSSPDGQIALNLEAINMEDDEAVRIEWAESGGPGVTPPEANGFGFRLIELSVKHQLGGEVVFDWKPEGLHAVVTVPRSSMIR